MTRIVLVSLLGAIGLSLVVLELVRRRRLQERYSMLWLATCLALIVLAAVPGLLNRISSALGIAYPPNALFIAAFGFVLLVLLNFSIAVSRLSEQTSRLAQRLAMLEEQVRRSGEHPGRES
ncbi:MAG: hypothetical protein QOK36_1189 [Gaiellales bacterium]|nr:hypothetical protein [Gaiellales bacterium]